MVIKISKRRPHITLNHRLRGSASPVLTATHHSYGSPRLSDFFRSRLWGSDPQRTFTPKWLKRCVFTQECAFCSRNRNFSYPLISRAPKRSKFRKFLDLENFCSIWPLTLQVKVVTPICLGPIISEMAGDRDLVAMERLYVGRPNGLWQVE